MGKGKMYFFWWIDAAGEWRVELANKGSNYERRATIELKRQNLLAKLFSGSNASIVKPIDSF